MRFGIIGTNFISDWLLAAMPHADCRAVAVYSRTRETGEAFAAKHGISLVFTDMDAFLASDAFEAVYIATPNALHPEQSLRALRAGKHVLVEKPAAPSLAAWQEMRKEAEKNGCVIMEAMRPVHDPNYETVRAALAHIAPLRTVHLDFCQYSSRYDKFLAGEVLNAFRPELSNAALLDIGVYPTAVAAMLFGMPQGIKACATKLSNGFEGGGTVLLDYGEMQAVVTYSKIAQSATPSSFLGEGGSLTIDKVSEPSAVTLLTRGAPEEALPVCRLAAPNNMDAELRDFCRAVETGECPACEVTDITLAILDECRRQTGVRFPSDE